MALQEFVGKHSYIMLLQKSEEFILEVEGELRTLLLPMRREDKSILYRRAQRYYKGFGLQAGQLTGMLDKFCSSHPVVLSGKEYEASLGWDEAVQLNFLHLMRAGACLESETPHKQQFYESFGKVRSSRGQAIKAWSNSRG